MQRLYIPCAWWRRKGCQYTKYTVSIYIVYVKFLLYIYNSRLRKRGFSKELFRRGCMC